MRPFWLLLLLALMGPVAGRAQDDEAPLALFADDVTYQTATQVLTARGRVEVYFRDGRLSAEAIVYDARAGVIRATGPLRLVTPDGSVMLASLAELSPDLTTGLIEGARLLIGQQFQIAAVEARRSEGRYTSLYRAVGSSCQVCAENPVPVWRIRAERVIHDSEARQIRFENARFDLFGVPVAWLPRLRIPDPSVDRASGFLTPDFSSSDIVGLGAKVPYYIAIGDHADATVTPFVTSKGAMIVESEYRRRFARGWLQVDSAFALDDGLGGDFGRGFILARGQRLLPRGFVGEFQLDLASDDSFLRQFGYSEDDRLTSFVVASRVRDKDRAEFRIQGFQSLRPDEDDAENPLILPEFTYRRVLKARPLGGRLTLDASLLGLVRQDGRDVLRLGTALDWRRDQVFANGLQFATFGRGEATFYNIGSDPAFDSATESRFTPTLGAELRFPLMKNDGPALHVIEPVAQVIWSRRSDDSGIPNEDSLLPELDETNLFALNRFPGQDRQESGLRANIGVNYTRYDPAGWNFGLTVGQVIRRDPNDEFAPGTGLSGTRSDFVAAASFALPPELEVISRVQFDDNFRFKRSELELALERGRLDLSAGLLYLAGDDSNPALGIVPQRNEVSIDTTYRVADNWEASLRWDYDIAGDSSTYARGGLIYSNECIEVDFSVARRFTTSGNVPPSTDIGLTVSLAGLGGSGRTDRPAARCRPGG